MAFIANPVHGLSLGGLVLVENGDPKVYTDAASGQTYKFNVLDPDTHWGNPEPVTVTLLTLMTDGSQVEQLRYDNREPSIALTVEASGAAALAAAEVALRGVIGKATELRWQPPSASSAITVFDVVWSRLDHKMDSLGELYFRRSYSIALQALPHARSASKVLAPAVTTAAPTVVDSGSATTNWTAGGPAGATVSVVSGAVRSTYNPSVSLGAGLYGATLRRTAAITVSTSKFIAVDWKSSNPSVYGLQTNATSGNLVEVRREPAPTAGFNRSWFQVPDAVTSLAWIQFGIVHPAYPSGTATLEIDQVLQANALPVSGSSRQLTRTIYPGGSVPAEGTIIVQHDTAGLGSTIIFTHPTVKGYSPPLRQWRTAGFTAPVVDATTVSGSRDDLTGFASFDVPIDAVPTGDVQLWGRFLRNAVGSTTISGAAYSATSPSSFVGASQPFSTTVNFGAAFTWAIVPIARLSLPTAKVGIGGLVQIDIIGPNVFVDELWLFAMDEGRLTVVECGTGAPSAGSVANRLLLNAPSVDEPFGSIMVATRADFADAYSPNVGTVLCDQVGHRFNPDGSMIFTVASGPTTEAAVSLEYYRRWHTNAAT